MSMKMDLFFLSVLVTVFQASWSYYVSNSTLPWSSKGNGCNTRVATPTIQYGHKDLSVDMNGQNTKQEVWVGYYQQTALFEYIGCMRSEDLDISTIQLGTANIGRCYSACSNTPFIGIDGQMCYCMQVKPEKDIRALGCNFGCTDTYNAACGGSNFTSVYRMLSHNDSRHIPEKQEYNKNCLRLNISREGDKTYVWRLCSDRIWAFCTSDSDQSVKFDKEPKHWRDAATRCFQKHSYPIGYEDVRNVTFVGKYGWTGIVWCDVIYNDNDLEYSKNSPDISYGYLKYDSSVGYVLRFSKEDRSKYILCNDTPVEKETTQLTTITSDDNSSPTKHTHITTTTTERLSSTPWSNTPNTPNTSVSLADEIRKSHNDSSTKDTDIPVIVGVSVSATLAVVIIVILLILVQRKKIRCCTEGKQLIEVADQKNSKTKNPISHVNNSYELVDAEYIDTAIKTKSDLCDDTYNMPEEEADEVNTNETTYDIAGTDRQTLKQEHDNIYNKLQSESSPIYDHTNDKSKTGIQASDDTYNTTKDISVNSGFKLGGNHAVGMNTIEESPYNHTNSDPFERKQMDNVYNTASFQ